MECTICYEKFFTPTTKEEFKQIHHEIVKTNDEQKILRFYDLVITPYHNTTYKCSTQNCGSIICAECYTKITCNGKDIYDMDIDDMPSKYDTFICPYCRNIDWKMYMDNVLDELQYKVLGEEAIKLIEERRFPEFKNKS